MAATQIPRILNNTHLMNVLHMYIYQITKVYLSVCHNYSNMKYMYGTFPGYVSNYIHRKPLTINNLVLYVILYYYFVYLNRIDMIKACEQTQVHYY